MGAFLVNAQKIFQFPRKMDRKFEDLCVNYNHGQKCWEGNFILQIPPSPFSMLDFPGEKNGDFSYLKNSNIEYGGGGSQEHGISQILQAIVRKIELGVKCQLMPATFPTTFDHDCLKKVEAQ